MNYNYKEGNYTDFSENSYIYAVKMLKMYMNSSKFDDGYIFSAPAWEIMLYLIVFDVAVSLSEFPSMLRISEDLCAHWLKILVRRELVTSKFRGSCETFQISESGRRIMKEILDSAQMDGGKLG